MRTKGWVVREPTILPNSTEQVKSEKDIIPIVVNHNCYLPFEYFNGQGCMCLDGYARVNGLCRPSGNTGGETETCPTNAQRVNSVCVCNQGFNLINGVCVEIPTNQCPENSKDNGLGFCVCNAGYYRSNGVCLKGTPCPPSSTRNSQG